MTDESRTKGDATSMAKANTVRSLEDIRRLRPEIMELARQYRARNISVFGSLVRGEMHEDSDIDFLVDFEEEYTLLDHAGLLVGLEDLLGRKVDVVPRRALKPFLRDTVISEAQEL